LGEIILKKGEDRRIKSGHLWIFNNEIEEVRDFMPDDPILKIVSAEGRVLGTGYYNKHSLIAARILSWKDESIDRAFLLRRIKEAKNLRESLYPDLNCYRLVYSEADFLPGLIIDKYNEYFSIQILTTGMEYLTPLILEALNELAGPAGVILKNDSSFRTLENLQLYVKVASGEIPRTVEIDERGIRYKVDLLEGQKTGFFCDQKENRLLLRDISRGKKILDCFSYTGGFALNALKGDAASVMAVDSSSRALELLTENAALNGYEKKLTIEKADCFDKLKELRGERFDIIVLDPPAFIKSKNKVKEGIKGYIEINISAMKMLAPRGVLVTCSCSYHLSEDDFLAMLRISAGRSRRQFRLSRLTSQAPYHPVLLAMPETRYLKCAFLQAVN